MDVSLPPSALQPPPAKTPTPADALAAAPTAVIQEPPTKLIKLEIPSAIDEDDNNHIDVDDVDIDVDITTTTTTTTSNSFFYDKSVTPATLPPPLPPRPLSASSPSSADTKYCHICDIKFNYLNTFMAHKQFYCAKKTSSSDLVDVSSNVQASGGGAGPRTSPSVTATVGRAETSVL